MCSMALMAARWQMASQIQLVCCCCLAFNTFCLKMYKQKGCFAGLEGEQQQQGLAEQADFGGPAGARGERGDGQRAALA